MRRIECQLDRDLGRRERGLGVAARVVRGVLRETLLGETVPHVDEVREDLEIEGERDKPRPCCFRGVRCDNRDRGSGIRGLRGEERRARRQGQIARRPDHGPHPGDRTRRVEIERAHGSVCDRRAKNRCVQHPGQPHVDREAHAARSARRPVVSWRRPTDEIELGVGRPARGVVALVDEGPHVLVAALHLLLRANETGGHGPPAARRIARSILG